MSTHEDDTPLPAASDGEAGEVGETADTVAGGGPPERPDPPRTDSQARLHSKVRGRLFEGKTAPRTFEPGDTVAGRYRIISLLGVGGMGEVFRAHDLVLDQHVAIKFLPPEHADNEAFMKRFVNEVRLARKISHASVCRVHDIGEMDGRNFLSMEYIDGEDLASLLRRIGRLPAEKAFELAQQLCAGLAALHDAGVLHRDLKPANLMIDGQGRLKIADFGLAAVQADLRAHEMGDGTPAYMAPEQLRGQAVSASSDVYALGVVLYELLSGRHPHDTVESSSTGSRSIDRTRPPVSLARRVTGVSEKAISVIEHCLEDDPAARPQSVLDVAAALPGGDPIAAALLAGRAPSADALANISKGVDAPPSQALWFSLVVLAAVVFSAVLAGRTTLLGRVDSQLPPMVLTDRTKTMLADADVDVPAKSELGRLFFDPSFDAEHQRADPDFREGPTPLLFELRASPRDFGRTDPYVRENTPPMRTPGELRVWVDARGQLRRFEQVPPDTFDVDDPEDEPSSYDWSKLRAATGYDPELVAPGTPRWTPPFAADDHQAWDISGADPPVHIEAASWRGQPIWLEAAPPWAPRLHEPGPAAAASASPYASLARWLIFGALLAMVVLVRRVYVRGEADTRGAVRVALVLAASVTLAAILEQPLGNSGSITVAFGAAKEGLMIGGVGYLGYVVVEPFGRRHLPGTMVSWVRLTRGRWRDALVGRDILLGAAVGSVLIIIVRARMMLLGEAAAKLPGDLSVLHSLWAALGTAIDCVWLGAFGVMQIYLLFLFLLFVVRKRRIAIGAFFVLWTAVELTRMTGAQMSAADWATAIGAAILVAGVLAAIISRAGILAMTSAQIVLNVLVTFPFTTQLDAWYATYSLLGLATLGGLVLFGSRAWAIADTQARRAAASRSQAQTGTSADL